MICFTMYVSMKTDLYLISTNIRSEVSATVSAMSICPQTVRTFEKNAELMNIQGAFYEYFVTFSGNFIIYN